MSDALIAAVVETQAGLIDALDAGDVAAIETRTAQLSALLGRIRAEGAWRASDDGKQRVGVALQQCDAAKRRVNYLSFQNRERMERLTHARGGGPAARSGYHATGPRLSLVTV